MVRCASGRGGFVLRKPGVIGAPWGAVGSFCGNWECVVRLGARVTLGWHVVLELVRVEFSKSIGWRAAPPYLLAAVRARDAFGAAKKKKVGF